MIVFVRFLVEKVRSVDRSMDKLFTDLYYDYKRTNGYSEAEILNKEASLEEVLRPVTVRQNLELLKSQGFKKVDVFFKWYNFAGIIGLKE